MNRYRSRFSLWTLLLLVLVGISLQPLAQAPRPLVEPPTEFANQWVVSLAAGTDPYAVAGRMGLIVERAIDTNTYVFRAGNDLSAVSFEIAQTFDSGIERSPEVISAVQQELLYRTTRSVEDTITDPLLANQWHLNNTGQGGGTAGHDANVFAAWNAGYTGTGIVVSSVDNGVWHANPDISGNYLPSLSWDYVGNDPDPSGGNHGTSVAGVMAADNDGANCGVGVAFDAKISGIRLFSASSTDANEAAALSYFPQDIDIYNNSWGPADSGSGLGAVGPLAAAAIEQGITTGRGGLGSIYVWAAGNGGPNDNVNADAYANSRYTIAVAATTNQGTPPWYAERGATILINAPSNGGTLGITTTANSTTGCSSSFGGTSSASPLAAGVIALMLQANPNLTWRDVQHILVQTAVRNDPTHTDWQQNGAGLYFNHSYGFGRIDAGAAVSMATSCVGVAPEITVDSGAITVGSAIPDGPSGAFVTSTFNVTSPLDVESVDVIFNATHPRRGQLYVELISPSGTTSVLMHGRMNDTLANYTNWRFNTVANWNESSVGTWTIRVRDLTAGQTGTFNSWQLQIHGSNGGFASEVVCITQQPADTTVFYDEAATLTVGASGTSLSYQWYEGASGDTATPVGTNSATFTTPPLQANTQYWVRVTGSTTVDSQTALVTVANSVDMLNDPAFDIKKPPVWTFTSSEGKVACNKQFISATCAALLRNTLPGQVAMYQDVNLGTYPNVLQVGDTLELTLQTRAKPGSKTRAQIIVIYSDGTKVKTPQKFTADWTWQPIHITFPITRTDFTRIRARVIDKSATPNVVVWIDDMHLLHSRAGSPRGAVDVLPPPEAPDGFRGTN